MQVFGLPGHVIRKGRAASRLLDAKTPNIEAACLPNARPISLSDSPAFQRCQSSDFCESERPGRPIRDIHATFSKMQH